MGGLWTARPSANTPARPVGPHTLPVCCFLPGRDNLHPQQLLAVPEDGQAHHRAQCLLLLLRIRLLLWAWGQRDPCGRHRQVMQMIWANPCCLFDEVQAYSQERGGWESWRSSDKAARDRQSGCRISLEEARAESPSCV